MCMSDKSRDLSSPPARIVRREAENFIRLSLASLAVPFTVITDLVLTGNRLGERSVTEWSQSLLLAVVVILFADASRHARPHRGFYSLAAVFFACCLARELDLWMDKFLYHGSWVLLALLFSALGLGLAWRYRETIIPGAADFVGRRAYPFILIGLVIILVLSRVLGSGHMLWNMLGCDDTHRLFKTIIQESLESFGYLLFAFGAILLRRGQIKEKAETACEDVRG